MSSFAQTSKIKSQPLANTDGQLGRAVIFGCAALLRASYRVYYLFGEDLRGQPNTGQIISEKYKFACTLVPKVGTRSLRRALLQEAADSALLQEAAEKLGSRAVGSNQDNLPRDCGKDFFEFAFVRNPWSRVVSCYRNKVLTADSFNKLNIICKYKGLRPQMPFDSFVEWLCSEEGSDRNADGHWVSQHYFLTDAKGEIHCDFIGKLENFDADMSKVWARLGIDFVKVPHRNRAKASAGGTNSLLHAPYRELYSSRTRDLVAERYAKDIALFGYDF